MQMNQRIKLFTENAERLIQLLIYKRNSVGLHPFIKALHKDWGSVSS